MSSKCCICHKLIKKKSCYGQHEECFFAFFPQGEDVALKDLVQKQSGQSTDTGVPVSSFFHGKFKKYAARFNNRHYILKFPHPEYPELPIVEYVSNQLARLLSVAVPPFSFIRIEGQDCFVTENFMQDEQGAQLQHIYHFLNPKKDYYSCETVQNILYNGCTPADVKRFIILCCFDALIGNHDRHGRNLAIIQKGRSAVLSPFYDNPSYIALEEPFLLGADLNPTGSIRTKATDTPNLYDYIVEFRRLGHDSVVEQFLRKARQVNWETLIQRSLLTDARKNAWCTLIRKQLRGCSDA